MYNYEWDKETRGYLLNTKIGGVIKEVRPVFFEELKLLKFDELLNWKIPEVEEPLMWAEGRRYIYKGEIIAEARGGSLFEIAEIKSDVRNLVIEPVNIESMIEKNKSLLDGLVQKTLTYIYDTYNTYKNKKVDIFYVAFSGGKDSIVLLDLVQRALPHDAFKVVFADTTMELNDTIEAVEKSKKYWNDLDWHIAKSHMDSMETWDKIGPPAERMRWCCSVHKTAPQVLKIKEIIGRNSFKTLVFVGVRAEESETRSTYEMLSDSKKHIMQTSCCPILEWNTSELFLYLLENKILFNNSYRKGLTRAGCIFCPMSSNWSFMINSQISTDETYKYEKLVTDMYSKKFKTNKEKEKFFFDRAWQSRLNGRDISVGENRFIEIYDKNTTEFILKNPKIDWKIWVKTIGNLHTEDNINFDLEYKNVHLLFKAEELDNNIKISFNNLFKDKYTIRLMYLFKNALNKTVYCINCKVCMVECPVGAIVMEKGYIKIDGCIHCENCLDRAKGCLVADSLSISGGGNNMIKKNIAGYQTRGFKQEWLDLFFELGTEFWTNEHMGKNMFMSFKVWLREAGFIENTSPTELYKEIHRLGSDNILVWAIIFVNLAYESPLINWYVKEISFGQLCDNSTFKILFGDVYTNTVKESAISSLKETIKASPIGKELGQGECIMKGKSVLSVTRGKWKSPESLAILYSLYKFAEKQDRYYNFTLTDLISDSSDRIGLSPSILFGMNKENLQQMLQGLSHDYNDFIKVNFNKDLDNINLNNTKTTIDVVKLF